MKLHSLTFHIQIISVLGIHLIYFYPKLLKIFNLLVYTMCCLPIIIYVKAARTI